MVSWALNEFSSGPFDTAGCLRIDADTGVLTYVFELLGFNNDLKIWCCRAPSLLKFPQDVMRERNFLVKYYQKRKDCMSA